MRNLLHRVLVRPFPNCSICLISPIIIDLSFKSPCSSSLCKKCTLTWFLSYPEEPSSCWFATFSHWIEPVGVTYSVFPLFSILLPMSNFTHRIWVRTIPNCFISLLSPIIVVLSFKSSCSSGLRKKATLTWSLSHPEETSSCWFVTFSRWIEHLDVSCSVFSPLFSTYYCNCFRSFQ